MSLKETHVWVSQLARRYELATGINNATSHAVSEHLSELRLADAILDKIHLDQTYPSRQHHIAVLGPTQSGKSSLVNTLLDYRAASVSPLAGFTVHTQGYATSISDADIAMSEGIMAPLQKTPAKLLDGQVLDAYVLESVDVGNQVMINEAIVWDTPDFDSIDADSYNMAVHKSMALADMVIVVASKDKYGDKRVWDVLNALQQIGKPMLFCINKVADADRAVIKDAFCTRYKDQFKEPAPPVILLPFIKHDENTHSLPLDQQTRNDLEQAIEQTRQKIDSKNSTTQCLKFIQNRKTDWLEPLTQELNAQQQWQLLLNTAEASADEYYARNYLNNPDNYDTFNRTLAELLTLLEIPGVAPVLAKARTVVTWPARRLLGLGRDALGRTPAEPKLDTRGRVMNQEAVVLEHIADTTLISLQRQLMEAPAEPLWQLLNQELREQLDNIRERYETKSEETREAFVPEIERTAASLYKKLQTQPALLNTLRAARASADAAGIALAVKSGGLAPTDLILAPAMLSVTTLLTESALGKYLETVKRELKQRQREHIRQNLIEQVLITDLANILSQQEASGLLSINLEAELDAQVSQYLHDTST